MKIKKIWGGGTGVLEYILHGEAMGYDQRPSTRNREVWYDLRRRDRAYSAVNYMLDSTARTFWAPNGLLFSSNFHIIYIDEYLSRSICIAMNSTISQLHFNVIGRSNFGGGLIKIQTYEMANSRIVDPRLLSDFHENVLKYDHWDVMSPSPERRLIDEAVFDVLGLTAGERDDVYEGVWELVRNRKLRARSV